MSQALLGRRAALALPALLWAGGGHAAGPDEPKRGGILIYSVAAEPPTYDLTATSTFAVMHRLAPHYSTLLQFEPGNYPHIVGDLAESWTEAPDKLTYTFKLRDGVVFHDGSPCGAADVKASYDRMRDPPQGGVSNRQPSFDQIASIETPDRLTVVFRMKQVDALHHRHLCLALELHLQRHQAQGGTELPGPHGHGHRPVPLRRARAGLALGRCPLRRVFPPRPALSRRFPRHHHGPLRHGQRARRQADHGGIPRRHPPTSATASSAPSAPTRQSRNPVGCCT